MQDKVRTGVLEDSFTGAIEFVFDKHRVIAVEDAQGEGHAKPPEAFPALVQRATEGHTVDVREHRLRTLPRASWQHRRHA